MKKTFLAIALCVSPALGLAEQTPVTPMGAFPNPATASINTLKAATNTKLEVIEANRQDHEARVAAVETGKAAVSCFADSEAFNACFALDWPTGFDTAGDYTVTGEWDFTGATVTGISSGGISHATSDGSYYASRNGIWANLAGVFAAPLGSDDNYVTDDEKLKITGIATGAEVNVNADWNASSGDAQILNKPTIPSVSDTAYGAGWNGDTGAASKNAIYDKIETIAGGSMTYPGAGLPISTGTGWGTSLAVATTIGETGSDTNIPTEQAVREAITALPAIAFGTGLTVATDTPSIGTDTVSVTANTYQAYDADWLGVTSNGAALVSAANYAAMKTLLDTDDIQTLTGIPAGTAHLGTFAGSTITDSSTIKTGMQALETAVELKRTISDERKEIGWLIHDSDADTTVADGKQAAVVPASMNGMLLVDVTCSVADLNSAASGATTVVLRRVRGATAADMTSTGVTIGYDEYTASDETIDTASDDLATGDKLYVDVNTVTTAVQRGLSCTAVFSNP